MANILCVMYQMRENPKEEEVLKKLSGVQRREVMLVVTVREEGDPGTDYTRSTKSKYTDVGQIASDGSAQTPLLCKERLKKHLKGLRVTHVLDCWVSELRQMRQQYWQTGMSHVQCECLLVTVHTG